MSEKINNGGPAFPESYIGADAPHEAIDNGLLEPFAVFMPYMQLKDGRTVSEAAKEQGIGKFLSGTLALGQPALPAPEDAA